MSDFIQNNNSSQVVSYALCANTGYVRHTYKNESKCIFYFDDNTEHLVSYEYVAPDGTIETTFTESEESNKRLEEARERMIRARVVY